jgi:large subunit ribosomal protein L29
MTKAFELRDLSVTELGSRVEEQEEQVMNMRLQLKARKLDNPLSYRIARRELARLKTVLNQKRREAEEGEE